MKKETTLPELFFTDFNQWIQYVTGRRFIKKREVKSNNLWDKNIFIPNKKL